MKTRTRNIVHPPLTAPLLLLLALLFWASAPIVTAGDRDALQYRADGHVVRFDKTAVCVAGGDHALMISFAEGREVSPKVSAKLDDTPGFGPVEYTGTWNHVTITYEQAQESMLKSTYRIDAGAPADTVDRIRLRYNRPLSVNDAGELVCSFPNGEMVESPPVAWQEAEGRQLPVDAAYRLIGDREIGFSVQGHDPALPLIIDPGLNWNTFTGGTGGDEAQSVAADSSGNIFVAGYSGATWGSPVRAYAGSSEVYVARLASNGTLLWNTFLGSSGSDSIYHNSIDIDGNGDVIVGLECPATWGSPLNAHSGGDDFSIAKLNPSTGAIIWSTFMGSTSTDAPYGIDADGEGNIYFTGISQSTWGDPVHDHAGGGNNLAVAKLASNGSLLWNTFHSSGGDLMSYGGVAANSSGSVVVGGRAWRSYGSPVRNYSGGADGFVIKLASNGALDWITFLGSSDDDGCHGVDIDNSGGVFATGESETTWGSPLNAHTGNGQVDLLVAKLASDGSLLWHTFQGGDWFEYGRSLALDSGGNPVVSGYTGPDTWGDPVMPLVGGNDVFVAKFSGAGAMLWNSFYGTTDFDSDGSVAVDGSNNVIVTGRSSSSWGTPVRAFSGFIDGWAVKVPETPTPVELASFEGRAGGDRIGLFWETGSEIDNAGFHVWRCDEKSDDFVRVTAELIPAEGGPFMGATYRFIDREVAMGTRYRYKLEDVSYTGVSSFHGPVTVRLFGGVAPAGR